MEMLDKFENADFLINCFADNDVLDKVIDVATRKIRSEVSADTS